MSGTSEHVCLATYLRSKMSRSSPSPGSQYQTNNLKQVSQSQGWQTKAGVDEVMLDRPHGEDDRLTCLGASPSNPVILIAERAILSQTNPYFEVTLLEGSSVVIGLVNQISDEGGGGVPGRRNNSIGLFSTGDLLSQVAGSEFSLPFSSPFGQLDTIGIGCQQLSSTEVRAFATHNGRDLGTILDTRPSRFPVYPCVAFEDSGCIVSVKWRGPFLFEPPTPSSIVRHATSTPTLRAPPSSQSISSPPPSYSTPPINSRPDYQTWFADKQASFSTSKFGRKVTSMFATSQARSLRLEADLLEAQEHISVLANVLSEQDEPLQKELLKELTVSCRKLLVRHQNLVREATDEESCNKIVSLTELMFELLANADRILESTGGPNKIVAPTVSTFGGPGLVERGTADTVSEMLFMLRSGTSRSQKNAVQLLARLVQERNHNDVVIINGGVHALVALTKTDQEDQDLRKSASRVLAEIAKRVRLSNSNDWGSTARGVFKADLEDTLKAFENINTDEDIPLISAAITNLMLLITSGKPSSSAVLNSYGIPLIFRILSRDDSKSISTNAAEFQESEKIIAFGLSLLITRCPSSRILIMTHPNFFTTLVKFLLSEDDELVLYGCSALSGLLGVTPSGENEELDQIGQIVNKTIIFQSPMVLDSLLNVAIQLKDEQVEARHHVVISLNALVTHSSVLSLALEQVTSSQLIEVLLNLLARAMEGELMTKPKSKDLFDETTFFYSSHFGINSNDLNVSELKTRTLLSNLVIPGKENISVGWDLLNLSNAVVKMLEFMSVNDFTFDEHSLEIIVRLSSREAEDDEEDLEVQQNVMEILAMLSEKFKMFNSSTISALVSLARSNDSIIKERAASILASCAKDRYFARNLLQLDGAIKLCSIEFESPSILAKILHGLVNVLFFSEDSFTSLHGFGPNEAALEFLLSAVERFETDPDCATEACMALTVACSGKSALSVHYRCAVMKRTFLQVSHMSLRCDSLTGRKAAEDLSKVCGFSPGALQVVANESYAIKDWASLKVDVEIYEVILELFFAFALELGWKENPTQPSFPFFDQRVDQKSFIMRSTSKWTSGADDAAGGGVQQMLMTAVSDLKQSPPSKWLEVVANGFGHADTFEKIAREVSEGESKASIAKNLFKVLSSGSSSRQKLFDLYTCCVIAREWLTNPPTTFPGICHVLPRELHELLSKLYQGIGVLQRYLEMNIPNGFLDEKKRVNKFRVLRYCNTKLSFWSFQLIRKVIGEQLLKNSVHSFKWSLVLSGDCFGDSDAQKQRLFEVLFSCPSITSLSFSGKSEEESQTPISRLSLSRLNSTVSMTSDDSSSTTSLPKQPAMSAPTQVNNSRLVEEKLAQFILNLPNSISWLSFDRNSISAEGLRLVAAFLAVRSGLVGLSVTNSNYSFEEFADFLRCASQLKSLKYLDLSGNINFGDLGCSLICKSFMQSPHNSLVALDLCGIKLNSGGALTIDALLGVVSTPVSLQREAKGEARIHPAGLLSRLRYLNLAHCSLSIESISRLLYALSKKDENRLRVLDLDRNPHQKSLRQPLVSFLAFNTTIREFGFLENSITPFILDVARALASNKVLQVFRYSITTSNAAAGDASQYDIKQFSRQIETTLRANRLKWVELTARESESDDFDQEDDPFMEANNNSEDPKSVGSNQEEKQRMHVLFSSPLVWRDEFGHLRPLDFLDSETEKQTILTCFEEARTRGYSYNVDLKFDFGCTSDVLIAVLTTKPTCLHFSTHGEETYIVMEDGKGGMHPLHISQLEEICRAAQVQNFLKLVFISACSSIFAAKAFHQAGVRNVVALDSRVSDGAAQIFTRAFYLSLSLGDSIKSAFQIAREAVRSSPLLLPHDNEGDHFVLLGDGDDSVFNSKKRFLLSSSSLTKINQVVVPDPKKWRLTDAKFLEILVPGRNVDAYLTIVAILCKRVVTVLGSEGFGKSALLSGFVCKYLNERRAFDDGCVVLDLVGCKTCLDVEVKLNRLVRKSYSESNLTTMGNEEEEEEDELQKTIFELSKRKCILILDHVDEVLNEDFERVRFFLGHLLDRTKGLRLVIATRRSKAIGIPGHEDLVHTLQPLDNIDSARLFLRCCPHYHNDLHVRGPRQGAPPERFEFGLARHPLCTGMEGVAKVIVTKASILSYEEWTNLVEEVTEALMPPENVNEYL